MVSVVPLEKSDLVSRIISRIDASSQLLIVLIGLGITNAVVRFGDDLSKGVSVNTLLLFFVFAFYSIRFLSTTGFTSSSLIAVKYCPITRLDAC